MTYPILPVCTPTGTVAIDANVQAVVNAIKTKSVIPYGDYGGSNVYYFSINSSNLGNIVYTVFDRQTNLGLASFMVRFGAASYIKQILFDPFPRSSIELQYLILPEIRPHIPPAGNVIPS